VKRSVYSLVIIVRCLLSRLCNEDEYYVEASNATSVHSVQAQANNL